MGDLGAAADHHSVDVAAHPHLPIGGRSRHPVAMGTPMGDRHEIAKPTDTAHGRAGRRSCGTVPTVGAWMLAAAAVIGSGGATSIDHEMNKREKEIAGANGGESAITVTVTGNNWGTGRHSDIKAVLTSAAAQITRHLSADSRALFDALLMLFEVLMAVFMEKHTPKSSANSSLPASQSPNDETARIRPGAKGKGPSHNGERCANTRSARLSGSRNQRDSATRNANSGCSARGSRETRCSAESGCLGSRSSAPRPWAHRGRVLAFARQWKNPA